MANMFKSRLSSGSFTPVGDALPEEVIAGKTFMNASGVQTGTMVDNGAVSGTATPDTPYVIPEGYHNGEGQVLAGGLPDSFSITLRLAVAIGYASHTAYLQLTQEEVTLLNSLGYNYVTTPATAKTTISTNAITIAGVSNADRVVAITFSKE